MDMQMPIIDGDDAARMIKATKNANSNTPIIALTSSGHEHSESGTVFSGVVQKPVSKEDIAMCLKKLGFETKSKKEDSMEKVEREDKRDSMPFIKPENILPPPPSEIGAP
ncbi:hypothetical protein BT69DRAFT_158468 [Atractiella rhizophila]|nr:hypothetical protein BT69DRAFT_158468 [Atractiella rhizophila]